MGHIVFSFLDGASQRGNPVLVVEIIVVPVAFVSGETVVILCVGRSPGIVVTPGERVSAPCPTSSVTGTRVERIAFSKGFPEIVFGPEDGVSQCFDLSVPVHEFHIVQLQVHPVGVWNHRCAFEGKGIEVAGLNFK